MPLPPLPLFATTGRRAELGLMLVMLGLRNSLLLASLGFLRSPALPSSDAWRLGWSWFHT